jgi:hypothetical protein
MYCVCPDTDTRRRAKFRFRMSTRWAATVTAFRRQWVGLTAAGQTWQIVTPWNSASQKATDLQGSKFRNGVQRAHEILKKCNFYRLLLFLRPFLLFLVFLFMCLLPYVPLPAAARLLRLWVRISSEASMFVYCECCVSGRGLCDELITLPVESYRQWRVVVCDLETSWRRRPWPTGGGGCRAKNLQTSLRIHPLL